MVVTCSKCGKSRQELEIESFKTVERSHLVTICFDCIDGLKATIIERMKKELHRFIKDVDDSPLPPDPDDIIIPDLWKDKSHPEGLMDMYRKVNFNEERDNAIKRLSSEIEEIKKWYNRHVNDSHFSYHEIPPSKKQKTVTCEKCGRIENYDEQDEYEIELCKKHSIEFKEKTRAWIFKERFCFKCKNLELYDHELGHCFLGDTDDIYRETACTSFKRGPNKAKKAKFGTKENPDAWIENEE